MPLAPANKRQHTTSARVNPCVRPYQGTRTAAATKVTRNIRTLAQIRGASGSFRVAWLMRSLRGYDKGGVRYHFLWLCAGTCVPALPWRWRSHHLGYAPPRATRFLLPGCRDSAAGAGPRRTRLRVERG